MDESLSREMANRGRIGAAVTASRHDGREQTAAARAAYIRSWDQVVDPDGILPADERRARSRWAHKAHMLKLARASAAARRARAA